MLRDPRLSLFLRWPPERLRDLEWLYPLDDQ